MEPLRLVPLLASLQILLPPAAPTDLPPPPNITVTPEKLKYLIGDTVSIRCTAPWTKEKLQGFQFSGTSGWAVDVRTARRTYVYSFNVTGPKDGGSHACAYTVVNQFRRPVRSRESKSVVISVQDRPPRPGFTLTTSNGITIEGQTLLFLCVAPAADAERRFRFYKGKIRVADGVELTLGNNEAQLWVEKSARNHTGNFTCGYEEKTEGRWIPSYLSEALEITVKEAALAPRLTVDPPAGVVSEDYPLRLTCAASRDDFTLRFRFYRNGAEIAAGQAGSAMRNAANFSELYFPRSPGRFGGKFSCVVEENAGGTWVASPQSEAADVTVKDLPSQPTLLSDPPSGEVIDGDPLTLTCAADAADADARRRFSFYKDDVEQFSETIAKERSFFSVPAAEGALATGRFTCRYEEKVGETWVPSPYSQAMTVVTHARSPLLPLAVGCGAGAGALLLGLLLVVCLWRRRRGGVHWKGLHDKDDPSAYPMAAIKPDGT